MFWLSSIIKTQILTVLKEQFQHLQKYMNNFNKYLYILDGEPQLVTGLLQEAVPVGIFKLLIVEDFLNRMVAERNKFAEQLLELNFLFLMPL
ncbi:uncharacterized protein LOC143231594 isoform X2 [Tachypleus tridentatus]|uniref:uncharacterized protein LOC143231594 isoform X2 n=1 Tax=Tachypleus tridentatus TaxID=6853 RepID=UPI003FD4497A